MVSFIFIKELFFLYFGYIKCKICKVEKSFVDRFLGEKMKVNFIF